MKIVELTAVESVEVAEAGHPGKFVCFWCTAADDSLVIVALSAFFERWHESEDDIKSLWAVINVRR